MNTPVNAFGGPQLTVSPRARDGLGQICAGIGGSALLVTERTLTATTPYTTETVGALHTAGVETEVLTLPVEQSGTLQGAHEVHARMREVRPGVCIALGADRSSTQSNWPIRHVVNPGCSTRRSGDVPLGSCSY